MANPIEHAQTIHQNTANAVKQYIPGMGKKLAIHYAVLIVGVALINLIAIVLLLRLLPRSTANTLVFVITVAWLFYGWRFLEQRHHATALFVLYTRFSRERRALERLLDKAETLENTDPLYTQVDIVEEAAHGFVAAAQEQGISPQEPSKNE